jgi:hypothetical protein
MRKHGTVNHENLDGPGVVDATTSHELQAKAPDLKPVVKGTAGEVLAMKKAGQLGNDKVVFMLPPPADVAYIIDSTAVHALYGGSVQKAVTQARRDLLAGGAKESSLLGYPNREGVDNPVTAAVTKDGEVVTDIPEIKDHADKGNVLWAAEGHPADVAKYAENVSRRWKTIGDEPNDSQSRSEKETQVTE